MKSVQESNSWRLKVNFVEIVEFLMHFLCNESQKKVCIPGPILTLADHLSFVY